MVLTSLNLPFWLSFFFGVEGDCVSLYRTKGVKALLSGWSFVTHSLTAVALILILKSSSNCVELPSLCL